MLENYKEITLDDSKRIMVQILKEVDRICRKNNIDYWLSDGTLLGSIRHKGFIPWDDDIDIQMLRKDFEEFKIICKQELSKEFYMQVFSLDKMFEGMPLKIRYKNSIYIEKWDTKDSEKHGIYIDIFPMDIFSANKFFRKQEQIPKFLYQLKTMRLWDNKKSLKNFIKLVLINLFKILPNKLILQLNKKYLEKSLKLNIEKNIISYGYGLTWRTEFKYQDIFPLKKGKFEGEEFYIPNNPDVYLKKLFGNYMKEPDIKDRKSHAYKIMIKV